MTAKKNTDKSKVKTGKNSKAKGKTASGTASKSSKRRSKTAPKRSIPRIALVVAILCAAAAICALFLFDLSHVTSNAMKPALNKGDLVVSWNPKFVGGEAEQGDIALISPPEDDRSSLMPNFLRCIADNVGTVAFKDDVIRINDKALPRYALTNHAIVRPPDAPDIWRETLPNGRRYRIMLPQHGLSGEIDGAVSLKSGEYFLAGDNRMASYDSRQMGAVDSKNIRGRAIFILHSAEDDGFIGHWFKLIGNP